MLQPVSVQSAAGASQVATAAADQPLEPPGILEVPQGFKVVLSAELSLVDPMANSSIFTFHKLDIHSQFNFSITVASYGGLKLSSIFEELVVGIHFSQKISFTAIGTQASFHSISDNPLSFTKLYDFILPSYFFILAIK